MLAGVLLTAGGSIGDPVSGQQLFTECWLASLPTTASADAAVMKAFCDGFIAGVLDTHIPDGLLCIPSGVSTDTLAAVVLAWLRDHPGMKNEEAYLDVFGALSSTFKCR
jgi:hypothetical protein